MKLYTYDKAPNPRRVHWVMAEKGIENIERVQLDIINLEHRAHPVLAKAPTPNLPILECDDGSLIGESLAIARYLEAITPTPNLFGLNASETAHIEMWTRKIESLFANPLMLATRQSLSALKAIEDVEAHIPAYFIQQAQSFVPVLEKQLNEMPYLAGDRFTIADIVTICAFDFSRLIRFKPTFDTPHLDRWVAEVRARPAWAATR